MARDALDATPEIEAGLYEKITTSMYALWSDLELMSELQKPGTGTRLDHVGETQALKERFAALSDDM